MTAPQSLRAMQTPHLQCRNFTHPWEVVDNEVTTIERRRAWILFLKCARCKARTKEIYFPTSRERKRMVPTYPNGYLVEGLQKEWGGRMILNQNVRHELFSRMVKGGKNGRRK